jgi:hypothetical protein
VVRLRGIEATWRRIAPVSFFKCQSIGRDDDIASLCEFRSVCLICIAFQSDNFALSQMKLARMLMVRKDCGYTAIDMLGHEQEGLDAFIDLDCVFDSLWHVQATIGCF